MPETVLRFRTIVQCATWATLPVPQQPPFGIICTVCPTGDRGIRMMWVHGGTWGLSCSVGSSGTFSQRGSPLNRDPKDMGVRSLLVCKGSEGSRALQGSGD